MPLRLCSLALVCAMWPCVALRSAVPRMDPASPREGLAFIKLKKVGGSSFGGALRRFAQRHGFAHVRDNNTWIESTRSPIRAITAGHSPRWKLEPFLRIAMPNATMVTLLRDPVERCMSQYYFKEVSMQEKSDGDKRKISFINTVCGPDLLANSLNPENITADVASIMDSYDFVGLTERFNESLLLLGHKLGASMADLLFLSAKESGEDHKHKTLAEHPPFEEESDAVKEAAEGLRWGLDAKLIKAANAALDDARAAYGPSFAKDLKTFEEMLELVDVRCNMQSEEDCLYMDGGCAQGCIDNLCNEQGWS